MWISNVSVHDHYLFIYFFLLIPFGVQKCELKYRKGGGFVSEE